MNFGLAGWAGLFSGAILLCVGGSAATQSSVPAARLHVPEGFVIELAASEDEVKFPMFATFDERGRLFVSESSGLDLYAEITATTRKCRVRVLQDQDGDGRYETSRVFAEQLVFPMGLAWRDKKLYVADPPDLVTLEDTDGDGRADKRTVILTGFGHRDNGSLHGLTFGPEGWLYMTMGAPDGYRLPRRNGTFLEGKSGALLRCRPDGADVEVLCGGFENLVEVVFTPRGEIIGTDNWFQLPSGGVRDALVHLVEGGHYPLNEPEKTPLPFTGEKLPAISLFPAVAISGLMRYEGTSFPESMRGNLFSAQHNTRSVGRHVLIQEGSSFRSEDSDFLTTDDPDFHPSDVLEAADGSLLVIDTGSWYVHHCPTGKIRHSPAPGGIYRVRNAKAQPINDSWGRSIDWASAVTEKLVQLLADSRPFVRQQAQQRLVARGPEAAPFLIAALSSAANESVKLCVLWTLANIQDDAVLPALRRTLQDQSTELIAAGARMLALRGDRQSASELCRLLGHNNALVRLAAAEALGRCGDAHSLSPLWQALTGDADRFFEHAVIYALHHLADEPALNAALANPNPRVQKAALWLLDQPPRSRRALEPKQVIGRIASGDSELRQTALRVLQRHVEWAQPAAVLLRDWLAKPVLTAQEDSAVRSLILALQTAPAMQDIVGAAMLEKQTAPDRRLLLLETISQSSQKTLPKIWLDGLQRCFRENNSGLRVQAVRTLATLQISTFDEQLAQFAENPNEAIELRLEALRALIARHPKLAPALVELLIEQLRQRTDTVRRLAAAEILRRAQLTDAQLLSALRTLRDDGLISPSALLPTLRETTGTEAASALLDYLVELVRDGWQPHQPELEKVLERFPAELRGKVNSVRELAQKSVQSQRARLAAFDSLLTGGEVERGRIVFFGIKVACSACHAIGNNGSKVGPDLTKVGAIRSGRDILESIVLPSSTFAQGYENYLVTANDEHEFNGVIARQSTDLVVLRDASGGEVQIRKDQIKEMKRSALSLMPEGLENGLSRDELRDLLAFLQSLK